MNKKFTILIDLDDTIVDLSTKWRSKYNRIYKENISEELWCKSYDFSAINKDNPKSVKLKALPILRDSRFFSDLKFIHKDTVEIIEDLSNRGHRLIIATSSVVGNSMRDKGIFCYKYFPFTEFVIIQDKSLLKADIIFDDNPEHINKCNDAGMITVCRNFGWNQDNCDPDFRVNDIEEFAKIVKELEQIKEN